MRQISFFHKIPSEPEFGQAIGGLITMEQLGDVISSTPFHALNLFNCLLPLSRDKIAELFEPILMEWAKENEEKKSRQKLNWLAEREQVIYRDFDFEAFANAISETSISINELTSIFKNLTIKINRE